LPTSAAVTATSTLTVAAAPRLQVQAHMAAPVPFIQVDPKTKKLFVSDVGRKALSGIKGTVGVCAVAGVYRTGESPP